MTKKSIIDALQKMDTPEYQYTKALGRILNEQWDADDADIVVCHTGLAGAARNAAPEGSVLIQFTMFMNDPNLKKLITDISEDNEITSS